MNEGEENMESEVEDDDPDVHPDTLLAIRDMTDAEKLENSMGVGNPFSYYSEDEILEVSNDGYMYASPSPLKTHCPETSEPPKAPEVSSAMSGLANTNVSTEGPGPTAPTRKDVALAKLEAFRNRVAKKGVTVTCNLHPPWN